MALVHVDSDEEELVSNDVDGWSGIVVRNTDKYDGDDCSEQETSQKLTNKEDWVRSKELLKEDPLKALDALIRMSCLRQDHFGGRGNKIAAFKKVFKLNNDTTTKAREEHCELYVWWFLTTNVKKPYQLEIVR